MELYEAKFSYILADGDKQKKTNEIWMVTAASNGDAEQQVIAKNVDNASMKDLKVTSVRAAGVVETINPKGKEDNEYDADKEFSWYTVTGVIEDLQTSKKSKVKNFVRATSPTEAVEMAQDVFKTVDYEVVEVKKTLISKIILL